MNPERKRLEIGVRLTCDNARMDHATLVQRHEVIPIQGQHRPIQPASELQDDVIGNPPVTQSDIAARQHIVSKPAKMARGRHGKIFVGEQACHALKR